MNPEKELLWGLRVAALRKTIHRETWLPIRACTAAEDLPKSQRFIGTLGEVGARGGRGLYFLK